MPPFVGTQHVDQVLHATNVPRVFPEDFAVNLTHFGEVVLAAVRKGLVEPLVGNGGGSDEDWGVGCYGFFSSAWRSASSIAGGGEFRTGPDDGKIRERIVCNSVMNLAYACFDSSLPHLPREIFLP